MTQVKANKDKGTVDLARLMSVTGPQRQTVKVPVSETVEVDGKTEVRTRLVDQVRESIVTRDVQYFVPVPLEDLQVFDLAWKPVSLDKFRGGLTDKPRSVILLERGGGTYSPKFDAEYLKAFKEGTLIVIAPAAPKVAPAPDGPPTPTAPTVPRTLPAIPAPFESDPFGRSP
jgi:hypothetical protein